jgi:hypothetical protein
MQGYQINRGLRPRISKEVLILAIHGKEMFKMQYGFQLPK